MTKVQQLCAVVLAVIGLASVGAWQFAGAQGDPRMKDMPKWEYKIIGSTTGAELNALGKDGWELVTIESGTPTTFYFKRPK